MLIIVISVTVNAQSYEYIPFPKADAIWSECYTFPANEHQGTSAWETYEVFTINGEETVINNLTYKKIYMYAGEIFDKNKALYIGGLREDNEKKVWFQGDKIVHPNKPYTVEKEILLYDFSLKIGDIVKVGTIQEIESDPAIVEKIDTIMIGNSLRKKFIIKSSIVDIEWIEGIGSMNGLFYCSPIAIPTSDIDRNELVGFMHKGDILYFNEKYPSFYPTDNESIESPDKYITVTTSSDNLLRFDFNGINISRLFVYNISGAILGNYPIKSDTDYFLSTTGFSSGIYIYQGVGVNGEKYTGKFVIK